MARGAQDARKAQGARGAQEAPRGGAGCACGAIRGYRSDWSERMGSVRGTMRSRGARGSVALPQVPFGALFFAPDHACHAAALAIPPSWLGRLHALASAPVVYDALQPGAINILRTRSGQPVGMRVRGKRMKADGMARQQWEQRDDTGSLFRGETWLGGDLARSSALRSMPPRRRRMYRATA